MPVHVIKDFTGGLQEDSVGANDTQLKRAQNIQLNSGDKPTSHFGRVLDETTTALHKVSADSNGYQRINTLIPYKIDSTDELLKHVGNKLVWNDSGSYSEIKTPIKKITGCVAYSGSYVIFVPGNAVDGIGLLSYVGDYTDDNFTAFTGVLGGPSGYTSTQRVNKRASFTTANTTAGSATITVASATGLSKGCRVTNIEPIPGFSTDTYITNISGTTVTLNQPALTTGGATACYFSEDIRCWHTHLSTSTNLTIYVWGDYNRATLESQISFGTQPYDYKAYTPSTPGQTPFFASSETGKISKSLFDNHLYVTDQTLKSNPLVVFKNGNNVTGLGSNEVCAIAAGLPRPASGRHLGFISSYKDKPETINASCTSSQITSASATAYITKSTITYYNSLTTPQVGDYIFVESNTVSTGVFALGTYISAVVDSGTYYTITLSTAATASYTGALDLVQRDMERDMLVPFTGASGSATGYSWAVVYSYTYTFNSKTYKIYSRPLYFLAQKFDSSTGYYPNHGAEGSAYVSLDNSIICPSNSFKRTSDPSGESIAHRQLVNVDANNIKIEVYRTAAAGNVFYLYGESTNKPTLYGGNSYINISNKWSTKNRTLYTTGGVAANYRPPICKYITASGPFMYYANGHEINESDRGGDLLKNRIWQSKPGLPYAVPADFYADVDEEVVGLATVKTVPIIFTENYIYRIEGSFDSFGRGGMEAKRITEITGCVSDTSIVQTEDGVYFAGTDGFYFTDGFIVKLLSQNISSTYSELVNSDDRKALISGGIDILNRSVHWSCKVDDVEGGTTEANASFTYDISNNCILGPHTSGFVNYNAVDGDEIVEATLTSCSTTSGSKVITVNMTDVDGTFLRGQVIVGDGIPFATFVVKDPVVVGATYEIELSNSATATGTANLRTLDPSTHTWQFFEQFQPTCYAYMGQQLYHGDPRGYTFKYDKDSSYSNVVDETNTTPTTWEKNPIKYHLATVDSDFGGAAYKKWVSRATVKLKFSANRQSNISVQPMTEREASGLLTDTSTIEATNNAPWGYPGVSWGSRLLFSNNADVKDFTVHMPKAAGLRSTYRAMHITNGDVVIQSSGDMATQTLVLQHTAIEQVKTLLIGASNWYEDIVGYYVKFFQIDANGELVYLFDGKEFWISDRVSDTEIIVVDEDLDLSVGTLYDFEVRGYRKKDIMELQEIDYYFTPIERGQENGTQATSTSGA